VGERIYETSYTKEVKTKEENLSTESKLSKKNIKYKKRDKLLRK